MAKFKTGDLVQSKVGGPKMVVEEKGIGGERYWCTWFAGSKRHKELFEADVRTAVE